MRWLTSVVFIIVCSSTCVKAQSNKRFIKKKFELAIVPGVSTNGLHSAWYINSCSFSIFSSIGAANRYFQFAGISTLNIQYATGIQLAGIANIVGGNSFINMTIGEEREQMREGFESNMTGVQFAGLINLVRNNMSGIQLTGGINFVHDDTKSFQLAGISNMVGRNFQGIQVAGLYNVALESSSGIQLALLSNLSNGTMQGVQISALNKAWRINGHHSDPPSKLTGWQIGLVNLASRMDGLQIGLINRARKMRGTQIGLINFFSTAPNKTHGKNGIPIGLLNFGSYGGHQRTYLTETFTYNFEVSTGNCYNCTYTESGMPLTEKTKKLNQNNLIFSYNNNPGDGKPLWSLGYGFERLHYRKNSMSGNDPKNEKSFISYGIKLQHLNFEEKIRSDLSLLSKVDLTYGRVFSNAIFRCYLFGSLTGNAYFSNNDEDQLTLENKLISHSTNNQSYWPGYEIGIQIY